MPSIQRSAPVAADGGFRREHDRIGAVEHGVGDVRKLPARVGVGARIIDSIICVAVIASLFFRGPCGSCVLQRRNGGVTDFDGQIAARNHQAVRSVENLSSGSYGFDALDLGDGQGAWPPAARTSWRAMYMSEALWGRTRQQSRHRSGAAVLMSSMSLAVSAGPTGRHLGG